MQGHPAAAQKYQEERDKELSMQAERAELAALDAEAEFMGDAFPANRVKRRAELRQARESDPKRQVLMLQAVIDHQGGIISDRQGRLRFEQARQDRLDAAEQAHKEAEVRAAAQRYYWGVESPADMKLLSQAGVDVRQIPRRLQP